MSALQAMWSDALGAWKSARAAELAYDNAVYLPALDETSRAPRHIEAEVQRLQDVRCNFEDAVFAVPALNVEQLATKMLIAFDDGRNADAYMPTIMDDCRRFACDSLTRGKMSETAGPSRISDAGHRGWLNERNDALRIANDMFLGDFATRFALARLTNAEDAILTTAAVTDDDVIAKLIVLTQIVIEGHEPNEHMALAVLREAISHFGMGCALGGGTLVAGGEA